MQQEFSYLAYLNNSDINKDSDTDTYADEGLLEHFWSPYHSDLSRQQIFDARSIFGDSGISQICRLLLLSRFWSKKGSTFKDEAFYWRSSQYLSQQLFAFKRIVNWWNLDTFQKETDFQAIRFLRDHAMAVLFNQGRPRLDWGGPVSGDGQETGALHFFSEC